MDVANMSSFDYLVLFALDGQRYALHLSAVNRIINAVEITPLPKAPDIVLGVVNVQGQVIPVVDIRQRFRLPQREMQLGDHIIIAKTSKRAVALVVDSTEGVIEYPKQGAIPPEEILPGTEYIDGVIKLEDGLVLIHNLDSFLSLDEEKKLDNALEEKG